jgi:Protein of unknown function (DUF3866)
VLRLRRGMVVAAEPPVRGWQALRVDAGDEVRPARADVGLVGAAAPGDEVVVNVCALDLGLGSGGFDLVHVNLSAGLDAGPLDPEADVLKLNYTSLQHVVSPVEGPELSTRLGAPVAVLFLHGQLAPLAWAFGRRAAGARLGYVQTWGGALPGGLSETVGVLRDRGLLAGHLTAGASYGGEGEAITVIGALHHGLADLGWHAAVCGPGPGILGSASALGHGGMAALESAHGALALGCRPLIVPRLSAADPRPRHRGVSHHTRTVLELLLRPVDVAAPRGTPLPAGPHRRREGDADLDGFRLSGLPARTMGRGLDEDPLFFAAPLAGGEVLAVLARES